MIQKLLSVTDLFFCDIKLIDEENHKNYTGVGNALILENLKKLHGEGKQLLINTPLVPGITDTEENIADIAGWMKRNIPQVPLRLLNYNLLARAKWESLGLVYKPGDIKPLKEDEIKKLALLAEKEGVNTTYRMG